MPRAHAVNLPLDTPVVFYYIIQSCLFIKTSLVYPKDGLVK